MPNELWPSSKRNSVTRGIANLIMHGNVARLIDNNTNIYQIKIINTFIYVTHVFKCLRYIPEKRKVIINTEGK